MKIISILFFLIPLFSTGQVMDLDRGRITKIELLEFHGNLKIEGSNTNRIIIERIKYNNVPQEVIEPFAIMGYKKSDFEDIHVQRNGGKLTIRPSDVKSQFADYRLKIPNNMILKVKTNVKILYKKEWNIGNIFSKLHNEIIINNIEDEIEISTYTSNIQLSDITGPIICSLYEGKIDVLINKFKPETISAISIFEGEVNMHFPKNISCFIELSLLSGNINSDFDIENVELNSSESAWVSKLEKGESINKHIVENPSIIGTINEGGTSSLSIDVHSGTINIIKQKK